MERIDDHSDERQKSWCIYCGASLESRIFNRDHVPSRALLAKPYPENLPQIKVCKECNEGFSLDEEYLLTFLSCVLCGSTDPGDQKNIKAKNILADSPKLRERIEKAKSNYRTIGGEDRIIWTPEIERVKRVALKNARGHAYYECGEPIFDDPSSIDVFPLTLLTESQRKNFERIGADNFTALPEVGSRMMTRIFTGQDMIDDWVVVQPKVYRYAVSQEGGILVRSVMAEYLATEIYWE